MDDYPVRQSRMPVTIALGRAMFLRASMREIWIKLYFFGDFRSAVGRFPFSSFGRIMNRSAPAEPTDSKKCRFV
jgi:hypothetical protein